MVAETQRISYTTKGPVLLAVIGLALLLFLAPAFAAIDNATMVITFDSADFNGTAFEDQSGYGNDLLIGNNFNASGIIPAFIGQGYNFTIAQNPFQPIPLNLSSSWTYCAYVQSGPNAGEMLGSDYNGTQTNGLDLVNTNSDGTLTIAIYNNTVSIELDRQNAFFFPGSPGVVCVALDAANDTTILWFNGTRLAAPVFHLDADITDVNFADGQRIYIGSDQDTNFYDGIYDTTLLFNQQVLSDDDVLLIYNALVAEESYPFPAPPGPNWTVTFNAVDNINLLPINGFCVELSGPDDFEVCTDFDEINVSVQQGTYDITFSSEGYQDKTYTNTITADTTITGVLRTETVTDLQLFSILLLTLAVLIFLYWVTKIPVILVLAGFFAVVMGIIAIGLMGFYVGIVLIAAGFAVVIVGLLKAK